jgi:hypothetical protein
MFIQGFFDNVSKHGPALGYMQWEVPLLSEWLQVGAYWTVSGEIDSTFNTMAYRIGRQNHTVLQNHLEK